MKKRKREEQNDSTETHKQQCTNESKEFSDDSKERKQTKRESAEAGAKRYFSAMVPVDELNRVVAKTASIVRVKGYLADFLKHRIYKTLYKPDAVALILEVLFRYDMITPRHRIAFLEYGWYHVFQAIVNHPEMIKCFKLDRSHHMFHYKVEFAEKLKVWSAVSDDSRNCHPYPYMKFPAVPRFLYWIRVHMKRQTFIDELDFWKRIFQTHCQLDGSGMDIISYQPFMMRQIRNRGSSKLEEIVSARVNAIQDFRLRSFPSTLGIVMQCVPKVLLEMIAGYALPIPYWQQTPERLSIVTGLNALLCK
jgi:hypothetical protein